MGRVLRGGQLVKAPVLVEKKVIFRNEAGQLSQTTPQYINEVAYDGTKLLVTFTTRNSIYSRVPMMLSEQPNIPAGTAYKIGETIMCDDGNFDVIKGIYGITEQGIIIYTERGSKMIGDIAVAAG